MIQGGTRCVYQDGFVFFRVLERKSGHVSAVEKDRCGWFDDGKSCRLRHDAGLDCRSPRSRDGLDHAGSSLEPVLRIGSKRTENFRCETDPDNPLTFICRIVG